MSVDRPRPLVAGNWKMNGLKSSHEVLTEIQAGYTPGLKAKVEPKSNTFNFDLVD